MGFCRSHSMHVFRHQRYLILLINNIIK
jgi:hypothetical protein